MARPDPPTRRAEGIPLRQPKQVATCLVWGPERRSVSHYRPVGSARSARKSVAQPVVGGPADEEEEEEPQDANSIGRQICHLSCWLLFEEENKQTRVELSPSYLPACELTFQWARSSSRGNLIFCRPDSDRRAGCSPPEPISRPLAARLTAPTAIHSSVASTGLAPRQGSSFLIRLRAFARPAGPRRGN